MALSREQVAFITTIADGILKKSDKKLPSRLEQAMADFVLQINKLNGNLEKIREATVFRALFFEMLWDASSCGVQLDVVKNIVSTGEICWLMGQNHGIDINAKNRDGYTALHLASRSCHFEIVEYFLARRDIKVSIKTTQDKLTVLDLICYNLIRGHKNLDVPGSKDLWHGEILKLLKREELDLSSINKYTAVFILIELIITKELDCSAGKIKQLRNCPEIEPVIRDTLDKNKNSSFLIDQAAKLSQRPEIISLILFIIKIAHPGVKDLLEGKPENEISKIDADIIKAFIAGDYGLAFRKACAAGSEEYIDSILALKNTFPFDINQKSSSKNHNKTAYDWLDKVTDLQKRARLKEKISKHGGESGLTTSSSAFYQPKNEPEKEKQANEKKQENVFSPVVPLTSHRPSLGKR